VIREALSEKGKVGIGRVVAALAGPGGLARRVATEVVAPASHRGVES
jgi:hypothetical protein